MSYTIRKRLRRCLISFYHSLGVDKMLMIAGYFDRRIDNAIRTMGQQSKLSKAELKKDIKRCYCRYLTTPEEYFLFGFEGRDDRYRRSFLSDNQRIRMLIAETGEEAFENDLKDKYGFYLKSKPFFHRNAIILGGGRYSVTKSEFVEFVNTHQDLFVKPISSTFGRGAHLLVIKDGDNLDELYEKYSVGSWIIEDRVIQDERMAVWNESSVNTVRLPCLLMNGKCHILDPFIRTGRKGEVIDNAGGGGILACIDPATGCVISDGMDEANIMYKTHPDSGVQFKGWQIPDWESLVSTAEQLFVTCFPNHKYIGFDFALTKKGWIVIEGNWGQFVGQYASRKGIKEQFLKYMGR